VFLAVQIDSLTVPNFVLFFKVSDRKFNEDSKNVLKTIIFLLQRGLTPIFYMTVPNFVLFFKVSDRKFNEDSKNVLKTVIFSLQVGFTSDFIRDCSCKLYFWQFKF